AQRELQLRVEKNGELLRKLMEEQPSFFNSLSKSDQEQSPSSSAIMPSPRPSTHTATKSESKCHKRLRGESNSRAASSESIQLINIE
ncbi:hypothetical protein P3X46_022180, partial [Hevea brasiliensis]